MAIELRDIADRLNQTTIRIAIDLASVRPLVAGESMQFLSDVDTEVYVVRRFGPDNQQVTALAISADRLVISAERDKD